MAARRTVATIRCWFGGSSKRRFGIRPSLESGLPTSQVLCNVELAEGGWHWPCGEVGLGPESSGGVHSRRLRV